MNSPAPSLVSTVPPTGEKRYCRAWDEFFVLPENRSAVDAVRTIGEGLIKGSRAVVVPLMLHGPSGTGKSFLCSSLIREVSEGPSGITSRSISAGDMARSAGSDDESEGFAERDLATCDLLVLEDVQLLPAREANAVCELIDRRASRDKATIVTASTGPAGLRRLTKRLTSRLASGLVVQLKPLSAASRRFLLEAGAKRRGIRLAPDAIEWLVGQTSGDGARAVLGILNNLLRVASAYPGPLGRAAVIDVLSRSGRPEDSGPDIGRIVTRVATAFGVPEKELLGASRLRRVMMPRQVAMYLAREVCGLSLPRLGSAFGRDHSTVLHACRKIELELNTDAKLAGLVRQLRDELV